jgi:hypothetical protein
MQKFTLVTNFTEDLMDEFLKNSKANSQRKPSSSQKASENKLGIGSNPSAVT